MFENKKLLGINSLGRIGKLTLWEQIRLRHFDGIVVNVGRNIGSGMDAILHTVTTDSSYGPLSRFLYGYSRDGIDVEVTNETEGEVVIDGIPIKFLRSARNTKDIEWGKHNVHLVVDCTGVFKDPITDADDAKGSLRGHLAAGAKKVILSAPFKIKDPEAYMPGDCGMFVYGINHKEFDPAQHDVISSASCTTTGLSHMMKPLLENRQTSQILTASMSTIHAATNTQSILDSPAKAEAADLRKNRSIFNNIILSTTGAAKALGQVLPEIQRVGFMADSVRIPTNTASVIVLNVTFHTELNDDGEPLINRDHINEIYQAAAAGTQKGLLIYRKRQNVSADVIGTHAATILEGFETHTRTGFSSIPANILKKSGITTDHDIRIPVTHAKIFGWYDNEYGSYTYCLNKLVVHVDKNM